MALVRKNTMTNIFNRQQVLLAPTALGVGGCVGDSAASLHPDLAMKVMIVGRRKPGTTLAEHRHHIRNIHGELVLQNIAADPVNAPRRYVQNAVFDATFRAEASTDPFATNRDFVTQIWVPDLQTLGRARQSTFYIEKVKGDEDNFVDQASVVFMPVRERAISGVAVSANHSVKLFGFVKRASTAKAEDFYRAWTSAIWPRGPLRHVQNDTLPTPMGLPPVDGIDEFWFENEADAHDFLPVWKAWVDDALVRSDLASPGSYFALLAHEDVVHAGPR
jgi:vanillate O-demethylase ferredoxin subunit